MLFSTYYAGVITIFKLLQVTNLKRRWEISQIKFLTRTHKKQDMYFKIIIKSIKAYNSYFYV